MPGLQLQMFTQGLRDSRRQRTVVGEIDECDALAGGSKPRGDLVAIGFIADLFMNEAFSISATSKNWGAGARSGPWVTSIHFGEATTLVEIPRAGTAA
jgi:hypothetical protein